MLQVALAPSPVACGKIQQRRRAFFVATAQHRRHMDGPAGTPHQRRLDEVVAQNMPTKWFTTLQFRKSRTLRKGAHADDGVVPPVVTLGSVPPRNAGRDQRTIKSAGE